MTVIQDPQSKRFRMWYDIPSAPRAEDPSRIALIESTDGIHWIRPHRVLETPTVKFGVSVIDEGSDYKDPSTRFKLGYWNDGGLQIAASPDGIAWKQFTPGPVVRMPHDLCGIEWDPIHKRYMGLVSTYLKLDPSWSGTRRIPHMSVSDDLIHWREPWLTVKPDPSSARENGETQFYGLAGVLPRGELLVGMVKILRDDLNSEPGSDAKELGDMKRSHSGLGYTVLVWSRDGEHWTRDTEPFLDRNPATGTWDHGHAWGDDQVPVGDEVFIYYGGYRYGHKGDRWANRQIGLARLRRDRYVAYVNPSRVPGHIRTIVAPLQASRLTINAQVEGALRVRVCDEKGKVIPGFDFHDCQPIKGDALAAPVQWTQDLASLKGKPVQFVFTLTKGKLCAFDLAD
jgi:hypothetical protein